ncbi:MFS transporter [Kovacikia minuta CCNUW1]|uniref:MFS transporter n=1 Tax=Kovacikia minuta TaxID=2931930 RepID=UPI001CCCA431|nr:MFS transporter [Kovacikia minuta]UBF25644.1 MFS transporter [Kovacikia minuta CCNUW1]
MPTSLVWIMAIASGATVANLYYNQPLLAIMAQGFHASAQTAGLIPMLTQIGYAVGILLFVPLGDLVERRRLIVTMVGATAGASALAAVSPNITWLIGTSFAIGMTAIAAQVIVPFAAHLANPQDRGRVIGFVMSGLLIGILLARTVSGFIGATLGWQAMYWLASGSMVLLAIVLAKVLPESHPPLRTTYPDLMGSLLKLVVEQPVLRQASIIGAMSFGAFSAFWSTLVFLLEHSPYHYGSEVAGLFGLVGVVGALAAPFVGKLADRSSPKLTVGLGILTTTLSFLVFWGLGHQIWGLVMGVILLDLGVQSTQISNQAGIYSLPAGIHSRLNALYIMFYFVGGAFGSFLGAYGWHHWQWDGVCILSLLMLGVAFIAFFRDRQNRQLLALPTK